jgi:hypothetical protein
LRRNHEDPEISGFLVEDWTSIEAQILKEGEDAQGLTFKLVASALRVNITHYTQTVAGSIAISTFTPISDIAYNFTINLLLKPGHYDIINLKSEIEADRYDFETASFGEYVYA